MKNFSFKYCMVILFFLSVLSKSQETKQIEAKIETQDIEGSFGLKAVVKNLSTVHQSLNYIFLAVKKDKRKNMSSSQQQNKFTLLPKETKTLSEITMNLQKDDALKVYLFIKDEKTNKVIAKDSLEMNANNFKDNVSYEKVTNEENMLMNGVIINETRTRVGDEFYGRFYSMLTQNSLQFSFRIKILEVPTTGRNTQIQVFANDENILTFIAKPEEEYMKESVSETVASLIRYDASKKISDKGFIY